MRSGVSVSEAGDVATGAYVSIMFVDVVESVRLVATDEVDAVASIQDLLGQATEAATDKFHASVVESRGDGLLLVFSSANDALHCAMLIQRLSHRSVLSGNQTVSLRIGLHSGAIHQRNGTIYGSSTNFAEKWPPKFGQVVKVETLGSSTWTYSPQNSGVFKNEYQSCQAHTSQIHIRV